MEKEWLGKYNVLKKMKKLEIDTGMHWAGIFILKMMKNIREKRKQRLMNTRTKIMPQSKTPRQSLRKDHPLSD